MSKTNVFQFKSPNKPPLCPLRWFLQTFLYFFMQPFFFFFCWPTKTNQQKQNPLHLTSASKPQPTKCLNHQQLITKKKK